MPDFTLLRNRVTSSHVTYPVGVKPAVPHIGGHQTLGRYWNGTELTDSPPPPPPPEPQPTYATATEARKAMVGWIDGLTAQILDQYPRAIQARWVVEEAAARAVKHDANEPDETLHIATPEQVALVTDEGAAKGRTPEEHADAIIANADAFRAISAEINKLFLATDAALQAETDPFQYEAILEAAKSQAAPLAEMYGLDVS